MFYTVLAEDYIDDPENCTWYECEGWVSDMEDAVQNFMEYTDDDGDFGCGTSSDSDRYVLVYDAEEKVAKVVRVTPDPTPGYYKHELDDIAAQDEGNVVTSKVEMPKYEQIS